MSSLLEANGPDLKYPIYSNFSEIEPIFKQNDGVIYVVNFWATWCPGCRAELPQIKALKDKFKDDVHFISVSNESYEIINASGEYETHSDFIYYSVFNMYNIFLWKLNYVFNFANENTARAKKQLIV